MRKIHPTAIVAPGAELANDVSIGPYAVVGSEVRVGEGTVIGAHAVLEGCTTIGAGNRVFQFAAIGAAPQDLKYKGERSELVIGDRNVIREFATLHTGTAAGSSSTRVGSDCLIMNYAHVGHDCSVGDHVIIANGAQLGGHVAVHDYAVIGAMVGIHQFVKVGESAILGAGSMLSLDVAPFCNATGDRAKLRGLNILGLKRRGFSAETIAAIKKAYRIVFRLGLKRREALEQARHEVPASAEAERLLFFVEHSERGLCR